MSSGSSGVRGLLRRVAQRVAVRVAGDDLFEKRGERAHTEPLPPRDTAPPSRPAAPPAAPPAQPVVKGKPAAKAKAVPTTTTGNDGLALPTTGCQRGGLDLVRLAHGPGPRRRVVNHWATWCVPCVDELPLLIDLARRYQDRVDFLGVSWDLFDPRGEDDDIVEHVARFADGNGVIWPSVLVTASPESFFSALGLSFRQVPQTWIIDSDGRELARFDGVLTPERVAEIGRLLDAE